ncbi:MAG TPA: isoprenylcysteine carboxylmethyltransferase family protein [Terriglobales bacterium]|nr:isoprenylcysteine carboxylmethyltransferase family protein [Terriglobales bacterium]
MNSGAGWARFARRARVPLGFLFAALYLWLAHPSGLSILAGGAIALGGVALRAAASGHVKKNEALTTTGPYAYTRNPLYLGSVIIAAGFAVAARSWWLVAAMALLFVTIYVPVIQSEEAFLGQRFPEFADYAQRVPRLLPRFGKVTKDAGTFSSQLYLQHREYNAAMGTAAMLAALVAKLLWFQQ